MPLGRAREPFSHPDWISEVKWDGFRSLIRIEQGACKLVSRKGNEFKSFSVLSKAIPTEIQGRSAVLDGARSCASMLMASRSSAICYSGVANRASLRSIYCSARVKTRDTCHRSTARGDCDLSFAMAVIGSSIATTLSTTARGCSGRLDTSTSKESSPSGSLTLIWRGTRLSLRFETGITLSGRGGNNCSSGSAGAILISKFGMSALWHATAPRCDPEDCQLTTGKVDSEFRPVPPAQSILHHHSPRG